MSAEMAVGVTLVDQVVFVLDLTMEANASVSILHGLTSVQYLLKEYCIFITHTTVIDIYHFKVRSF